MKRTKGILRSGVAMSLILSMGLGGSGMPVRAQAAGEADPCAELEGAALEACLAAREDEAAPEPEGEADAPEAADQPALPADDGPSAEGEGAAPAEAGAETGAEAEATGMPEAPAEDEVDADQGIEDDALTEPVEGPEVGTDADAEAAAPPEGGDAEPEIEAEAEAVTEEDTAPDADAGTAPDEVMTEPAAEADAEAEGAVGAEPETGEAAEPDLEAEDATGPDTEFEAEGEPGIETGTETETGTGTEEEISTEPEENGEVEATGAGLELETEADLDAGAEAEAIGEEDLLSEEELSEAQRAEVEAVVEAAIAAQQAQSEAERARERDERMRILGAAAAGLVAGAVLPQIGARLVGNVGDRVVLQQDDRLIVRHDETPRLSQGGEAEVESFADGVTRVTVTRPDGSRVMSWRDAGGTVVRRVKILPDGREITLFDGLGVDEAEIRVTELPPIRREEQRRALISEAGEAELARVLLAQPVRAMDRTFTLRQILENDRIRWLMPSLALDAVTFETNSATLGADQIRALDAMGRTLRDLIRDNPEEVFLVEGHTDAVGSALYNLALSDRRAETVATLLTAYYDVPPENLVVQGFGKQDLKVPTLGPSRENRRVELRRITPLLR